MSLCQYSELFGKPGEGLHSYRIFNIAIVDVLLTFLGAKLLEWYVMPSGTSYWFILIGFFILGIILHRVFCVQTTIDRLVFGSRK